MRDATRDDLVAHQARESIMIRMESFGDEFERVARTVEQGVMAERFKNDVHDFAKGGPVTAADLGQLGEWLKEYSDQFVQLAGTAEQKKLAASFKEFVAEVASPETKEVFQRPLVNGLIEEITSALANGHSNGIPVAWLSDEDKRESLEIIIDWTDYINRGLDLERDMAGHIERIIDNAIAGKPSEQWMGRSDPLAERFGEMLNCPADETAKAPEKAKDRDMGVAALLKETLADEAAGKREDAHWYGMETLRKIADGKTEAPAAEKGKDRDIER
jgi:hypothetical protein